MGLAASSRDELLAVADLIDRFLDGDVGPYEWDDFMSLNARTPELEALQAEIGSVGDQFPHATHWCSDEGLARLRAIAHRVRTEAAP